jgi:hypothetical protein
MRDAGRPSAAPTSASKLAVKVALAAAGKHTGHAPADGTGEGVQEVQCSESALVPSAISAKSKLSVSSATSRISAFTDSR